jgi:putative phosphoribosyl transferase
MLLGAARGGPGRVDLGDEEWTGSGGGDRAGAHRAEITLDGLGPLDAVVCVPVAAKGIALVVHGCGPARDCPGAWAVARALGHRGFAVVVPELLTEREAEQNADTGRYARDRALLARRAVAITRRIAAHVATRPLPLTCFGAGAGAAIALAVAAELPDHVRALVSCVGRVDLLDDATLARVDAPVLLLAGTAEGGLRAAEKDARVLSMNRAAEQRLPCARLVVLRGGMEWERDDAASEVVAALSADWFERHLRGRATTPDPEPRAARQAAGS